MDKNSGEMGSDDAKDPSSSMHEEGGLKKVCNASIDSFLANEMLVSIFEFLPAADRMRVELVSKKWNGLASKWGWSKYTIISIEQFPECDEWKNACSKFSSLFIRCGQFIKEIDFSILRQSRVTSDYMFAWLPLLPNLRHLNLDETFLSTAALTLIADTFPDLISLRLTFKSADSFGGITSVLDKCKKLENLQIYDGETSGNDLYHFVVLPLAIKCVQICKCIDYPSFFLQVAKQGIQLESLNIGVELEFDMFSFYAISFDRLRYLILDLDWSQLKTFSQLVKNLSHLEALELDICDGAERSHCLDGLFGVVASECPSLKHFGLYLCDVFKASSNSVALLAGLPNLCSIDIRYFLARTSIPVNTLFEKLSLSGQLQHFNTSEVLVAENVCKALVQCKGLTGIFCRLAAVNKQQQQQRFDLFLDTLEKIHEGERPPTEANDKRILHTNFGNHSEENLPHHPWARFYKEYGRYPSSRVRERIYFEGMSSEPNSLSMKQPY